MKKKIAGVLTTVLAASLLVGGNHPVTVQVDNMISGTQDDEDTQSDEAEAEAAEAEEEQSEEAKVAADPEDQPAATETPKEEKKAEKETQKREAVENSSDSTSSDEKTLLKKAVVSSLPSPLTPNRPAALQSSSKALEIRQQSVGCFRSFFTCFAHQHHPPK